MAAHPQRTTQSLGIRQLKAQLSQQLRRVEAGETIAVTDRGRVIATINPVARTESEHPAIEWAHRMVAEGKATWSGGKPRGSARPARLRGTATVSDAVLEDRR
ncbi:type II toxin-antitoxin system prevent-host-death family antitoxin [soil metagenome]